MNREAVALGVPVWTTFAGRLGGVDEWLIREGRLRRLIDAAVLPLERRARGAERVRRDPALFLSALLDGLARPAR
jgi:predicted glycosyltransferase